MASENFDLPRIVSRADWLAERKALLQKEKELLRRHDAVSAERRRLPMVLIDKPYVFEGPHGQARLIDLFEGRRQLIVYHFMFEPDADQGCSGCSFQIDDLCNLTHLHARRTTFVLISRAPLARIEPFRKRMGWDVPWYSSHGSDFNYDFNVTQDEAIRPVEYNYRTKAELLAKGEDYFTRGENSGLSVFLRDKESVFHTYSTYSRGSDLLGSAYSYLDLTPFGRQEDWEQPPGRSDGPFMEWLRHHDRYDNETLQGETT
jgi:predicted dithiol-disulfide oxidoreductase (DUF899 family)